MYKDLKEPGVCDQALIFFSSFCHIVVQVSLDDEPIKDSLKLGDETICEVLLISLFRCRETCPVDTQEGCKIRPSFDNTSCSQSVVRFHNVVQFVG